MSPVCVWCVDTGVASPVCVLTWVLKGGCEGHSSQDCVQVTLKDLAFLLKTCLSNG